MAGRWCELAVIYLGGTAAAYLVVRVLPWAVVPFILAAGVVIGFFSTRQARAADIQERGLSLSRETGRILVRWLLVGGALAAATWWWAPRLWVYLPREEPALWLRVMLLYPLLSAFPQEVIFRRWFFQRYRVLFPGDRAAVLANGIIFGLAHVVMDNGIAVAATMPLGWLLAWTYLRTRSLLLAWLEHTLYGALVFTIGLGFYFIPVERARKLLDHERPFLSLQSTAHDGCASIGEPAEPIKLDRIAAAIGADGF